MKRVLLIADDRLIANFHREKLEHRGFQVETARQADAALKIVLEKKPDMVLLDPVLPNTDAAQLLSQINASAPGTPLFIFGNCPRDIARQAEKMGTAKILPKSDTPSTQIITEAETLLGEQPLPPGSAEPFSNAESAASWLKTSLETAAESIGLMRRDLHALVRNPHDVTSLQNLFRNAHFLSERTALVGLRAVYKLTTAIESLVYGLHKMPEEINPSVLRTLSQSVDFLAVLLAEENLVRAKDPSSAVVFAVDDDAQGREMIAAAMKLAELNVKTADTPKNALALLEAETFNLIFLDIGLPEMSGFDVCTRLRGFAPNRQTPVVFLTGLATFQNRVQGSLSGGNDFIAKPFNLHELGLKALLWVFKAQIGMT